MTSDELETLNTVYLNKRETYDIPVGSSVYFLKPFLHFQRNFQDIVIQNDPTCACIILKHYGICCRERLQDGDMTVSTVVRDKIRTNRIKVTSFSNNSDDISIRKLPINYD